MERVKPDPALYEVAMKELEVKPSEVLVFEDSANGLKAALAAGVKCVIVPNDVTRTLQFEKYHLRLESMEDKKLTDVLEEVTVI